MFETPPMRLPFLSFPLLPTSLSIFFLSFNTIVVLHLHPFIHLAFIPVISVSEFDWLKSQVEGLWSQCVEGLSVLYLLLHSSRSIAAFSVAWACVNTKFSTDYLAMEMIKVTEHLCMFTSVACMLVLACYCALLLEWHAYAYVLLKMWAMCVIAFLTTIYCIQPVFDILWWSNTEVLCGK